MSESHEDNLNMEYKKAPNQKLAVSYWTFGTIFLMLLTGLAIFSLTIARPQPQTITEFPIQEYSLYGAWDAVHFDMAATDNGFRLLNTGNTQSTLTDFNVDLTTGMIITQEPIPLSFDYTIRSSSISANLDMVWSDTGNVTVSTSAAGKKSIVSLNAPVRTGFSRDGRRFAIMNPLGEVVVYDTATKQVVQHFSTVTNNDKTLILNEDGSTLLTFGFSTTAHLHDVPTGTSLELSEMPAHPYQAGVFLSSNNMILTDGMNLVVVSEKTTKHHRISNYYCELSHKLIVSDDSNWLILQAEWAVCIYDLQHLLQLKDGEEAYGLEIQAKGPTSATAISKDSRYVGIYTSGPEYISQLNVLDLESGITVASTEVMQGVIATPTIYEEPPPPLFPSPTG